MTDVTRRQALAMLAAAVPTARLSAQSPSTQAALDARVRKVFTDRAGTWRDLNVPESDGQLLHDLIVQHKYTRALEIGTSTGHSGLWIAWALSKTGGRLVTVELDETGMEYWLYDGKRQYKVGLNAVVGRPIEERSFEPSRLAAAESALTALHDTGGLSRNTSDILERMLAG